MSSLNLTPVNQREFRKLMLSIKAGLQRFGLLLAICDDVDLQRRLTAAYEMELQGQGVETLRVRLDLEQPSLHAALESLAAPSGLWGNSSVVVTLSNASELAGLSSKQYSAKREQFLFSLQWTREGLRQFEFPVVLWLTDDLATRLARQAPDFWSWRSGVFEFEAEPQLAAVPVPNSFQLDAAAVGQVMGSGGQHDEFFTNELSIKELEGQIAQIEKTAPASPLLITLYNSLGEAYERSAMYQPALDLYEKALTAAKAQSDLNAQAIALHNKGNTLASLSRYEEAIAAYTAAIATLRTVLEDDPDDVEALKNRGNSLQGLADLQAALSQHQQAQQGYADSIAAYDAALSRAPDYVNALNNKGNSLSKLANLQAAHSQHQQAQQSYADSIAAFDAALSRAPDDAYALNNKGNSLSKLANLQAVLSQYQQAQQSYADSIAAFDAALSCAPDDVYVLNNKGNSLSELANLQAALAQHQQAQQSYADSIAAFDAVLSRAPDYVQALDNKGSLLLNLGHLQVSQLLEAEAVDSRRMALELFARSLAIAPNNTQIRQIHDQLTQLPTSPDSE